MNIIDKLKNSKEHTPDLQIKEINFGINKIYIVNIQTVSSSELTNKYVLEYMSRRSLIKNEIISSLKKDIINYVPSISFLEIKDSDVFEYLFSGFSLLIYKDEIIALETKAQLDRSIMEPSSEPTIKGPKDSFVENYNTNIGLVRKRIKDENLYIKEVILGTKSKTHVSIMYMNDIVDKELLESTIEKISSIKTEKVLDTYYIKSLINGENTSSFPTIKSTEKPDTIAKALTEGKICVISENSCNVLIIPTFFIDFFHNDEDIYQKRIFASFVKVIRLLALFITIFAPSIYLSIISYDPQVLPIDLLINFAVQRSNIPFPTIIELLILMFLFEILYEADALTPSSRGTSLSVLGALILGDASVSAGIVSPIMVIVVAVTAISSLVFVYYDFQSFIRLYRYSLLILSYFFGVIGVLFGIIILITKLCSIKSFDKPFMIPLTPRLNTKSKHSLIRRGLMPQNAEKGNS